jgi:hypothetical protein
MAEDKSALAAEEHNPTCAGLITAFILVFIVVSRWALAPGYLYYFDSANFALSLESFNPGLHQPQPPGYPLYVGLLRLIHIWVERPEQVQVIAGLLAACGSALLIRVLGAGLFGGAAGILSMVLLASSPVFWFGGLTNQVRVFLSLSSLAIALLGWRALTRPDSPWRLYAAFAALGVAGGFRPVAAGLLLPLLLWVWLRTGRSWKRLAIGLASVAATSLPWIAVTVAAVGGPAAMIQIMWDYSNQQFAGSSALFGADTGSAWKMFAAAAVWSTMGALVWIWALPFTARGLKAVFAPPKAAFLAVWFLPPFLFSAFVHIGDPDQALASVPAISVAGGAVLATLVRAAGARRMLPIAAAILAAHTLMFFKPPGKLAKAASYPAVSLVDRIVSGAIEAIASLRTEGPVTIVSWGSVVSSRQLEYYFPEDYVLILPGSPGRPDSGAAAEFYRYGNLPIPPGTDGLLRPGSRRVICLLAPGAPASSLPEWRPLGPVFFLEIPPGQQVKIGSYTLKTAAP